MIYVLRTQYIIIDMYRDWSLVSFSFKPLWKQLIDKDLSKKMLSEQTGISKSTIDKMTRGDYVSLEVIDRLCIFLNCKIEDVLQHEKEK